MSQGQFDEILYCHKVNNYIEDATDIAAGNDKFDSDQLATMIVPAGKRWILLGGVVNRDASSTLTIYVKDASDNIIHLVLYSGATAALTTWPDNADSEKTYIFHPIILDVGEYVEFSFGAAQGAGAFLSCVVLEVDV